MAGKNSNTDSGMQRVHAMSRANQIAALEVGECLSVSKHFEFDENTKDDIEQAAQNLASTMNKERSRAAERTGGNEYELHSGSFFTKTKDIVFTVVVQRVA